MGAGDLQFNKADMANSMKATLRNVEKQINAQGERDVVGDGEVQLIDRTIPFHLQAHRVPESVIKNLAPLNPRAPNDDLLIPKLQLCQYIFHFNPDEPDEAEDGRQKNLKRAALLELVNYLTPRKVLSLPKQVSSFL